MSEVEDIWRRKSNEEVQMAVASITDYTNEGQRTILAEAERRGLNLAPTLVIDQIRGRLDGNRSNAHVTTLDISKVSRLRGRSQFAPRILIALGVLQALVGLLQILSSSGDLEAYYDGIIYATLGSVYLLLAVAVYKQLKGALVPALFLLAIPTPLWCLMVADDVARDGALNHALPAVYASLAALGVVCCVAALRLEATIRTLGPTAAKSGAALQAKYFQNWNDHRVVVALMGAFLAFVIGAALALATIWVGQELARLDPLLVPVALEVVLLRIVGLILMVVIAPYFWTLARRFASISARELRRRDQRPSILYLRSFGDDALRFSTRVERVLPLFFPILRFFMRDATLEESLVSAASAHAPVVALSEPGRKLRPIGAARERTLGETWTETIDELIRDSVAFVAVIANTPGLLWELRGSNKTSV